MSLHTRRLKFFIYPLSFITLVLTLACASTKSIAENTPIEQKLQSKEIPVDDSFRQQAPKTAAEHPLQLPVPNRYILKNGLTVLVVPKHTLPLVDSWLVFRSGSAQDPNPLPGLASFTADLLKMGTTKQSAEQLNNAIEMLGTWLSIHVTEDNSTFSATTLSDKLDNILEIISDIVQHPQFSTTEIERQRKMRLADLAHQQDIPPLVAQKVFQQILYPHHPYGHTPFGLKSSLSHLQKKDLQKFHEEHFRPSNAALILVGDVSNEDAYQLAEKHFANWQGRKGSTPAPIEPKPQPNVIALVDKPNAPQSQILVGHLGISRSDPDYYPLILCNTILGGSFNSRINMNLREDKGYTYGARSNFQFLRSKGPFAVATGVRTDVTKEAIKEIFHEIEKMIQDGVTEAELSNAKNRYTLTLPESFQSTDRIAAMISNLYLYDLPLDYYQKLPSFIAQVTSKDIRLVAQRHLWPEKLNVVVVGDRDRIIEGLRHLDKGKVTLRDTEGKPL